jgi:geranylgeranyl diphosphate synthase type I
MQQILPAAAALELIHNFSLIHADLEDDSTERHHRATVWKLWGKAQAINAGDAMFSIAHLEVLKLRHNGVSESKTLNAVRMLSKACLNLCEGQHMDISYEASSDVTTLEYLDMITKKTAALLATATALGAYLGAADDKDVSMTDCFYRFGEYLGLAFQIRDDILGIWGDEKQTGKPVGADIRKKKKTLPILYALEKSSVINRKEFEEIYSRRLLEGNEVTKITGLLDKTNARKYAQKKVEHYSHQALDQLAATGLQAVKLAPLEKVTRSLTQRNY